MNSGPSSSWTSFKKSQFTHSIKTLAFSSLKIVLICQQARPRCIPPWAPSCFPDSAAGQTPLFFSLVPPGCRPQSRYSQQLIFLRDDDPCILPPFLVGSACLPSCPLANSQPALVEPHLCTGWLTTRTAATGSQTVFLSLGFPCAAGSTKRLAREFGSSESIFPDLRTGSQTSPYQVLRRSSQQLPTLSHFAPLCLSANTTT